MEITQITNYMMKNGYNRAIVNDNHIQVVFKVENNEAYAVVIVECEAFPDLQVLGYENMLRGIRSSLYRFEFSDIHMLGILATKNPEQVKHLLDGFGEHWVLDLTEKRLLIYENQISNFLNVNQLIEEAIRFEDATMLEQVHEERKKQQFFKDNSCSLFLVLLNLIVFIVLSLKGNVENAGFMEEHGALSPSQLGNGFWQYRIITSMFMHFGIGHFMNNMFMLLVMGSYIEKHLSKWKYLTIYMGAGIIGNIVSLYYYIYENQINVVCAGASGAIFGLTGALLWMIIKNRGQLDGLNVMNIVFLIVLNVYLGTTDASIGNVAHVGGLIGGFILAVFLYGRFNKEEA